MFINVRVNCRGFEFVLSIYTYYTHTIPKIVKHYSQKGLLAHTTRKKKLFLSNLKNKHPINYLFITVYVSSNLAFHETQLQLVFNQIVSINLAVLQKLNQLMSKIVRNKKLLISYI